MNRKKSRTLWPGMMAVVLTLVVGIGFSACEVLSDFFGGSGSSGGGGRPDTTSRADVSGLARIPGDGQITLNWTDPADADLDYIEITWEPGGTDVQIVAKGEKTYHTTGLTNTTLYIFTVKAVYTGNVKSGGQTISSAFTNIDDSVTYLTSVSGGGTAAESVLLPVSLDLSTDWTNLLNEIEAADKFVALDLLDCAMSGTEFNPGQANTGKNKVVSLILPDAATSIKAGTDYADSAFRYFSALTNVSGDSIVTVGTYAFYGRTSLATVNLPAAETIGYGAFSGCSQLATVNLPAAKTIDYGVFYGCTQLATVSLSAVETIGERAFADCSQLATVSLPAAETIGPRAFSGCTQLATVSLPAAKTIGVNAFVETGGRALTVTLGSTVPTLGVSMFSGIVAKTVTVKVPSGAEAWSGKTGTFTADTTTVNWGNGFRGGGWTDQSAFVNGSAVNSGITLTVEPY